MMTVWGSRMRARVNDLDAHSIKAVTRQLAHGTNGICRALIHCARLREALTCDYAHARAPCRDHWSRDARMGVGVL